MNLIVLFTLELPSENWNQFYLQYLQLTMKTYRRGLIERPSKSLMKNARLKFVVILIYPPSKTRTPG